MTPSLCESSFMGGTVSQGWPEEASQDLTCGQDLKGLVKACKNI